MLNRTALICRRRLTINPGTYSSIKVSGNAKLTLQPGIYVIAGGGISVTGNASVSQATVTSSNCAIPQPGGEDQCSPGFTPKAWSMNW
jgi:hypothetical protein